MIVSRDKSFVVIRVKPQPAVSVLRRSRELARASTSSVLLFLIVFSVVVLNF